MNNTKNNNLTELVINARDGVDGAFEALYKETVKTSYGVASLLLKNEDDIEDALQNSYMYVAKSIKDLKKPESFEDWLRVIVKHECQKYMAKHKRASDVFAAIIDSKDYEMPAGDELPFDLIERKDIGEKVREIVDKLPEDKRACIVLYYFEQNSLPEIAEILGIPEVVAKAKVTLNAGETSRVLGFSNFEATRKVWSSSDPSVATVDSHGNITAVSKGKCTVMIVYYGKDSLGNDIKASTQVKIEVKNSVNTESFKEYFRNAFDNFFEVRIHDLLLNFKSFMIVLFRYAY